MKKELKSIFNNSINKDEKYNAANKLQIYYIEIEKDIGKFEYWGTKTYEVDKNRPEGLYLLVRYFRETCQYYKAMHYYLISNEIQYTPENQKFKNLFLYEYTIFIYYINNDRVLGIKKSLEFLNNSEFDHQFESVFNNLEYYIQPLKRISEPYTYDFKDYGQYNPSSPSIAIISSAAGQSPDIDDPKRIIMNVRYKQYKISPEGAYYSHEVVNNRMIVRTDNHYCFLDKYFKPTTPLHVMPSVVKDLPIVEVDIKGLEDLRLFTFKDKIYYCATSREYSGNYKIVSGEYDYHHQNLKDNKVLESPFGRECEKNWLPIVKYTKDSEGQFHQDSLQYIYNYYPLQIGKVSENNRLEIIHTIETPKIFSKFRGSSNTFFKDGFYYFVVHLVKYTSPRKYYHSLVVLDKDFKLVKYSLPFIFLKMSIEYCLSLHLEEGVFTFIFSQWDDKPTMITTKLEDLEWIAIV